MKGKKAVFLTGAAGTMGHAGLVELSKRLDRFSITLLAHPNKINKEELVTYEAVAGTRIVWGDLTSYQGVLNGITEADYVLHVGGVVSPAADYFPKETLGVDTTAIRHIVDAVKAQSSADQIKIVYVNSTAQTGHHNAPVHWGRMEDPVNISVYSHYAISKTIAERIFVESGIRHRACLHQAGILCPELLLKGSDLVTFHVPLNDVLEWATAEDSGRLLANVYGEEVPDESWNRSYNTSSGPSFRLTNYEFESRLLEAIGCPVPEKIFEPNQFAIRNLRGQQYISSDLLGGYLRFRSNQACDDYFKWIVSRVPWYSHLAKIVPPIFIKLGTGAIAEKPGLGTRSWIKNRHQGHISAYFGPYEDWQVIPGRDKIRTKRPSETPVFLDHGYNESKPKSEWDIEDVRKAAEFRGGKCLSPVMIEGDLSTPLDWGCRFDHHSKTSPTLVLLGGHWCPRCLPLPRNYDEIAEGNPFFAQVWYPSHGKKERGIHDESIFADFKE